MNLAVFLPNWVGDVAMATPTLRALRRKFSQPHQLIGVMRPYVAETLAGTPWLDDQIALDARGLRGNFALVRALRRHSIDVAVLLTNSFRTAAVARLGGARRVVGYRRGGRGWLLSQSLEAPQVNGRFTPAPVLDYYLQLAYALGCAPESPRLELATTAEDERQADQVWRRLDLPPAGEIVAINSSGAFGAAKLWPVEHFIALARRVAVELQRTVLVLCGPSERALANKIAAGVDHPRVKSLAEESLSLGLSKACVRRSRLLVTTDSGPRHFAAAFDVPAITIFGPTHIAWSENHHARAKHLQLDLACSPCQQRVCPLGHHQCMKDLSVEQVFAAVAAELAADEQRRAA